MNETTFGQRTDLHMGLSIDTLESVRVEGHLRDLTCELTIKQTFVNPGKTNIEAVYTFPLPHGAVLLNLEARIGERELRGVVMPKGKAEASYEKAITDGNGDRHPFEFGTPERVG
jgi:hypothetical protein